MKYTELYENINWNKLAGRYGYKLLARLDMDYSSPYDIMDPEDRYDFDKHIPAILNYIAYADPTPNKIYTIWIVQTYISNGIRHWEDMQRVRAALKIFEEHKRRMQVKDIYKYKSLTDLENATEPFKYFVPEDKNLEKTLINNDEVKIIYNDKELKVLIPKTERASCYYGRNTRWCTAATNSKNYFDHYNSSGELIIVLDKSKNRRWQLHVESGEFVNEKDEVISPIDLLLEYSKLQKIFSDKFAIYGNDEIFLLVKHADDEFEKLITSYNDQGHQAAPRGRPSKAYLIIKKRGTPKAYRGFVRLTFDKGVGRSVGQPSFTAVSASQEQRYYDFDGTEMSESALKAWNTLNKYFKQ